MMKNRKTPLFTILVLGLLTCFLMGEELDDAGAPRFSLDSILDVVIFQDRNYGTGHYKAALVREEDEISLYLQLSEEKWQRFPDIADGGAMEEWPTLSLNEAGSLLIDSSHDAIGRAAWRKRLVIAYRQNEFIVAGYECSSYDKLAREPDVHFEVNYLTGKMILNKGVTNGPPAIIPLSEWKEPDGYP